MNTIERNIPATDPEIDQFLSTIKFILPVDFIDFYKTTNGAVIQGEEIYVILWALTELIELNKGYEVDIYAPEFFLLGSNGGGEAFAIEKATGHIFEIPFIGMSKEDARFLSKGLNEFILSL